MQLLVSKICDLGNWASLDLSIFPTYVPPLGSGYCAFHLLFRIWREFQLLDDDLELLSIVGDTLDNKKPRYLVESIHVPALATKLSFVVFGL
jgi:hypothetical protein